MSNFWESPPLDRPATALPVARTPVELSLGRRGGLLSAGVTAISTTPCCLSRNGEARSRHRENGRESSEKGMAGLSDPIHQVV